MPGVGVSDALTQQPLSDLQAFVLEQLQGSRGQMELTDLQLAVLVFSVPTHQFEVHPHLPFVLKRLEAEGVVERYKPRSTGASATQSKEMVQLRAVQHGSCG